ncbi:PD-(D/E)XK nuclease family protein [Romboutsia weinsteinii]|uniref:PD-(D/E)XK nuclease family protein n=1 Tax=Romboutsia weinsteinii TaxID=2020949 RepID=A0A371IZJ8_9FIRM|nr:PD-(D/E)XK nuclease family protein [Romboutsia weinsteinii]RDY25962.1 PD-(D/E)XK nuclease family protein [Romboutsia weinsteinii]
MNKKLKYFCYSQNSINTYKSCPTKFKYKYIDRINWKNNDIDSRDYYENLKLGRDFHLLCERYFSNISIGSYDNVPSKFIIWIEKIKKLIPIEEDKVYLPEYELRYNMNGDYLQAKYDLVVLGKNSIEIWDWKTESRKLDYKNVENRMQTVMYMFLAREIIPRIHNMSIESEDIKMKYYQPEFDNEPVTITYNNKKHENNKNKINTFINDIKRTEYERDKEPISNGLRLTKNKNHCKFCEFNKLCNGEEVHYSILEDEIYGT